MDYGVAIVAYRSEIIKLDLARTIRFRSASLGKSFTCFGLNIWQAINLVFNL